MVSRDAKRLDTEKEAVQKIAGSDVQVIAMPCDLSDLSALKKTLTEIEKQGPLGSIFFNAARINVVDPLTAPVEELEEDFRVRCIPFQTIDPDLIIPQTTNLALYATAQWGVPLLRKSGFEKPTFLVTGTWLSDKPLPALLSLSAVKSSQENMVKSFHDAFGEEIHFGLVKVMGVVKPDAKGTNPSKIAEKTVELFMQEKAKWELMIYVHDE